MNLLWIKNTEGLQNGIDLINQIDKNKFQKLLSHIADGVGEKNDSNLFSSEELLSLQKVLKLEENDVALVIKTVRYILKRLSRFVMRPPCLLEDLTKTLRIDQDKSHMFVEKYKFLIKNLITEFSLTNFGNVEELKNVDWQVNLEMTSSINQLERCPSVLFEMETNKSNNFDKLIIEFNEDELKNFHHQLETIQNEVDALIQE